VNAVPRFIKFMKNQLLNIFSLHRSGHHAIIFWILNKKSPNITSDYNPDGSVKSKNQPFLKDLINKVYYYNNINFMATYNEEFLNNKPTSYELMLNSLSDEFFTEGPFNFIVLRDFLNNLSSRFKKWASPLYPYTIGPQLSPNRSGPDQYDTPLIPNALDIFHFIDLWKNHARVYLDNPWKVIKYNDWVSSKDYRKNISANLDLPEEPDITKIVPSYGGGSSFIKQKIENNSKNYLSRFEQVKLPEQFCSVILQDTELLELNKSIFNLDLVELMKINKSL